MRDYARIHGLGSTVDWNENREKLAIEITNDMLLDGDVRHHKDLIIQIAIQKAKQQTGL